MSFRSISGAGILAFFNINLESRLMRPAVFFTYGIGRVGSCLLTACIYISVIWQAAVDCVLVLRTSRTGICCDVHSSICSRHPHCCVSVQFEHWLQCYPMH